MRKIFDSEHKLSDMKDEFKSITEGFWLMFNVTASKEEQLKMIDNIRNSVFTQLQSMEDYIKSNE